MTSAELSSARTYPGIVLAATTIAVVGAFAVHAAPALGLVLGVAGVWLSLRARRTLRVDSAHRGWGLSLAAMIVSSVTVAFGFVYFLAPLLLSAIFLISGGAVD